MIITCPACKSRFRLNIYEANAVKNQGRILHCGKCEHEWEQKRASSPKVMTPLETRQNQAKARKLLNQSEKIINLTKKPIVQLIIQGEDIEIDNIQAQIARLNPLTLRDVSWMPETKQKSDSSVFLDRPNEIEDEILKLAIKTLDSEQDANFAINELLPKLSKEQTEQGLEIILENYEKFKKEEEND